MVGTRQLLKQPELLLPHFRHPSSLESHSHDICTSKFNKARIAYTNSWLVQLDACAINKNRKKNVIVVDHGKWFMYQFYHELNFKVMSCMQLGGIDIIKISLLLLNHQSTWKHFM